MHHMRTKYNLTKRLSTTGPYHASFDAMWDYLPQAVIDACSSRILAQIIDAQWLACQESKRIALREDQAS